MFLTQRIEQAIVRATVLHNTQKRWVSGVPYIVHPYSVAFLLAHYVDDEDIIIAGLLHDTLEDIPTYTEAMLREEFGERVCALVKEVTEDFTQAEKEDHSLRRNGWRARKEKYLANLENDSEEALMIAAADRIHNTRSFLVEYEMYGQAVWEKFKRNRSDILWFHGECLRILETQLKHPLTEELRKVLDEARQVIGE